MKKGDSVYTWGVIKGSKCKVVWVIKGGERTPYYLEWIYWCWESRNTWYQQLEGNCIHDMVHSDTVWRDNNGYSVLQTVVRAVAQGQE